MLALSSLVLTATLFPLSAAHASHWAFDATGSKYAPTATPGVITPPGLPIWAPAAAPFPSNALTFPTTVVSATDTEGASNPSCTCTATLTIKATWVHDTPAQTDVTDPAPTSVWIVENSSASWSGRLNVAGVTGGGGPAVAQGPRGLSPAAAAPKPFCTISGQKADDGLNDPEQDSGTPQTISSGSSMTPTAQAGANPPAPGWSVQKVTGGTFTITHTLKATVTAAGNVPCTATASCTLGYSISIHAQPYNLRSGAYTGIDGVNHPRGVANNTFATLALSYVWDSTDGNKADLTSSQFNENVTWNSNLPGVGYPSTDQNGKPIYVPPSPPAGKDPQGSPVAYPNPIILGGPATANGGTDTFSPEAWFSGAPYRNISWWGDQVYVFSDSLTGETATPVPGPATGSFHITRTVAPIANTTKFGYTISTRTFFAGPMTLPGQ